VSAWKAARRWTIQRPAIIRPSCAVGIAVIKLPFRRLLPQIVGRNYPPVYSAVRELKIVRGASASTRPPARPKTQSMKNSLEYLGTCDWRSLSSNGVDMNDRTASEHGPSVASALKAQLWADPFVAVMKILLRLIRSKGYCHSSILNQSYMQACSSPVVRLELVLMCEYRRCNRSAYSARVPYKSCSSRPAPSTMPYLFSAPDSIN
jgi:hypothetical protein